jgi:hypothetical protein
MKSIESFTVCHSIKFLDNYNQKAINLHIITNIKYNFDVLFTSVTKRVKL